MNRTESFLRSRSHPSRAEYFTESLSIRVSLVVSYGGVILEASRGITVREINKEAKSEIIIAIPI
jgi:hypothetical protein